MVPMQIHVGDDDDDDDNDDAPKSHAANRLGNGHNSKPMGPRKK